MATSRATHMKLPHHSCSAYRGSAPVRCFRSGPETPAFYSWWGVGFWFGTRASTEEDDDHLGQSSILTASVSSDLHVVVSQPLTQLFGVAVELSV